MTDLKSCSFCGSQAFILRNFRYDRKVCASCMACGARGPLCENDDTAAQMWNHRQKQRKKAKEGE